MIDVQVFDTFGDGLAPPTRANLQCSGCLDGRYASDVPYDGHRLVRLLQELDLVFSQLHMDTGWSNTKHDVSPGQ